MSKYHALKVTYKEPEYRKSPPLLISSVGTEYKKNSGSMPYGAALLTSAGSGGNTKNGLSLEGISYIIHATPMPEGNNRENFVAMAAKAMQNSIILAERAGISKLAVCFLGGKIYCKNEDSKPFLAKGIIRAALSQLQKCNELQEVIFVDYDGNYYQDAWREIKKEPDCPSTISKTRVARGDLCKDKTHGARAIVNSEKVQMSWGGGISKAIREALGPEADNVDEERKGLMKEFNDLINEKINNDAIKISAVVKSMGFRGNKMKDGQWKGNYAFVLEDAKAIGDKNIEQIFINCQHPIFNNNDLYETDKQGNIVWYKISWQQGDGEDKAFLNVLVFKEDDFIEIKEIKKDNKKNENGEGNKPNSLTSDDWRKKLGKIDPSLGQSFTDDKVAQWQQAKGPFKTANGVKDLLESVKDDTNFLANIKSKLQINDLKSLIANKTPQQVITIIKRFEYDQLSAANKENKNKKIRKHYNLKENDVLTDDQINEFDYKVAIDEIDENSIKLDETEQIKPQENNILKIVGIVSLVLVVSFILILFIRKRRRLQG